MEPAAVWLQVRDDNPSAIHIYETHGFKERMRRTNWYSGPSYPAIATTSGGEGDQAPGKSLGTTAQMA